MPFFNNGEVRIYYQVEGSGQPLFLAHQATDSMDYWYRNHYVEKLIDKFQLIMTDARGHGQSDKPHDPNAYHARFVVEDFCILLDLLKIDRCHFWGYSMGGFNGLHFAKFYPSRLKSLVVGGAFPQVVRSEFGERLEDGFNIGIRQGPDALIAYFEDWWGPMPETLEARLRSLDYKASWAGIHQTNNRLDITEDLPKMHTPTLFYAGSEDPGPHKYAPLAAETMPNGKFVSFPGYTHGTISAEATLILDQVLPFLEEIS